ncbi:hypothetical protein [Streptomyces sp. NPDC020362]|uniref:DUF7144 family membrane protein n=1 Tax=unclassified Streptomyces TaxID=2593676 RepID=UPI0033F2BC47
MHVVALGWPVVLSAWWSCWAGRESGAVAAPKDCGDPVRETRLASHGHCASVTALYRKATAMTAMSSKTQRGHGGPDSSRTINSASLAAGAMMMLSGPLSILMGASGIAQDSLFAVSSHYAYRFDLTAWGVIHLVVGVALVVAGLGVLTDKSWGRGVGAAVAGISLITQFMFVPYYPVWSITVMTLDLLILFALTRYHIETSAGQ